MLTDSPELFSSVQGAFIPNVGRYPVVPGFKREGTSAEAARSVSRSVGTLRDRVLAAIRQRPSTADELAEALSETPFSIRPRCTELLKLGKITETPDRRRNASGRLAAVWKATV
jgi:hypothetical protein